MFAFTKMKKTIYIFLFYLVLNASVPCFLYSPCCDEKPDVSVIALTDECSDECDSCSPFFNCSDCVSKFLTEKNVSPAVFIESGEYNLHMTQENTSLKTSGIFQPPKTS